MNTVPDSEQPFSNEQGPPRHKTVGLRSLLDTYTLLQRLFAGLWRAVSRDLLPAELVAENSLQIPFDIHRTLVTGFRTENNAPAFSTALRPGHFIVAVDEIRRGLEVLPSLQDWELIGPYPDAGVGAVRSLLLDEAVVSEVSATAHVPTLMDDLHTGVRAVVRPQVPAGIWVPHADLRTLIRSFDWLTTIQVNIWEEMFAGRLSRDLVMPGDSVENMTELWHALARAISHAVRMGTPDVELLFTSSPEQIRSAAANLANRIAMIPFAEEFGVDVPDDPASLRTMEALVNEALGIFDTDEP